ncbi:hypothetical protein BJV82DRAFT_601246 [Fennellomyces sp. T-0311]|nr:hypothetical protein BJV82DRAFT_601246 [Fennellomyces sp. T-0311]
MDHPSKKLKRSDSTGRRSSTLQQRHRSSLHQPTESSSSAQRYSLRHKPAATLAASEPQQPIDTPSKSKRLPQKRKQPEPGSSSSKRPRRRHNYRKMENADPVDTKPADRTKPSKKTTPDDKSKGKAKAVKPAARETSTKRQPARRAKKQADPEELEAHETESDMESTPVSYFGYFEGDDSHETGHVTFDNDPPEEIEHNDEWDREEDEEDDEDEDEEERQGEILQDMEDDDDEEEEEEEEELDRVRRNLGLHMQSTFGGMMSDMSSRLRSILTSLKNDDPTMQLVALQELAEILSVSSEENLAGYLASDSYIKELVRIMKGPGDLLMNMDDDMMVALAMSEGLGGGNPELTLLACRCISNFLDAMPTVVTSVVYHGAIGVLCQKLKSIEYIDLAEQALSALEKVASHLPRAVVHEGGLGAALMYFDFFSIHSQRTALRTAANCMRGVDNESFSQVMEVIPTLLNTVSYPDRTVVELSCLCWVRLAESYRQSAENLEQAFSVNLFEKMMELIPVPGHTNVVRPSTFTDILRTFRILGMELLNLNVVDSLYQVLTGAPKPDKELTVLTHVSIDNKWRDSIYAILRIFMDILPSLPRDGMFSSRRFKNNDPVATRTRSSANANSEEVDILKEKTSKSAQTDPRVEYLEKKQDLLKRIDTLLFPLLLEIYTSTVNVRVRQTVSHLFVKLTHFSNAESLQIVLREIPLSSFLAGILAQQEHPSLVIDALFEVELLLKKLPDVYRFLFEREGVQHEVETLSTTSYSDESQTEDAAKDTEGEPSKDPTEAPATPLEMLRSMQEAMRNRETSDEDESEQQQKASGSSEEAKRTGLDRKRLLDRSELQALLRSRFVTGSTAVTEEKGIGRGSTRRYVIRFAQHLMRDWQDFDQVQKPGRALEDIQKIAQDLKKGPKEAAAGLTHLIDYLQSSTMGVSSFELMNSGLLDSLLTYLKDDPKTFSDLLLRANTDDGVNPIRVLVMRLQEIVSRFEPFEVVTPLESSSHGDNFRNPTSMLAKQLRLRLTGRGDNIPSDYQALMVSTHAVATFKVLEEYLLTRIAADTLSAKRRPSKSKKTAASSTGESSSASEQSGDKDSPPPEEVKVQEEDDNAEAEEEAASDPMDTTGDKEPPKAEGKWVIQFYLKDTLVSNDTTVYGAVHQYESSNSSGSSGSRSSSIRNIWIMSYPVTFERVWVPSNDKQQEDTSNKASRQLENIERPSVLTDDTVCTHALELLKAIASLAEPLHASESAIPAQDFINRKLTAKMNRQLEEPLIVASSCLPGWTYWLMQEAPYLFPFETRYLFIQCTSFGYSRLIARWQSLQMRNGNQRDEQQHQQPVLGRMERQKVRIMRAQMLESAIKILDLFGSAQSVLEIEYTGEEGTGLGPTLEFYAATSREFCKKTLNMWRDDDDQEGEYVVTKQGLFPKPLVQKSKKTRSGKSLESSNSAKIINLFKTLGQFVAKAMLDFRIIDFPFSEAFFKVALGHEQPSKELISEIDPMLGKSIEMLEAFVDRKRSIYADTSLTLDQKKQAVNDIQVQSSRIEDLCLDFTLPGSPDIELKTGGAQIPVTIHNVEEFIEALQDMVAGAGVAKQFEAFRQGFDQLFAIDDLKVLTYSELVSLFGVSTEDWSYATLADAIKADHGFTMESASFKNLLSILSEMSEQERREFLQFTTGSPRLPIGGWKAMRPVFTVVCKTSESPLRPDDYLPSVMTCANYLKMPDYSSKEKMRLRLLMSMKEGKNSFLLS